MRFQQNLAARRAEHCTTRSGCGIAVEKEDGSGQVAMRPPVSGYTTPGDRMHAVPPASGACGGGDNNSWVGAALRGEATMAVGSWGSTLWWCGHGSGGEEGRREVRWRGRCAGGAAEPVVEHSIAVA
jgi:hypothetical protein